MVFRVAVQAERVFQVEYQVHAGPLSRDEHCTEVAVAARANCCTIDYRYVAVARALALSAIHSRIRLQSVLCLHFLADSFRRRAAEVV